MKNIIRIIPLAFIFIQFSCLDLVNSAIKEEAKEKRRNDSIEKISEEENGIQNINYIADQYEINSRKWDGKDSIFELTTFYHTGEKYGKLRYKNNLIDGLTTTFHKNGKPFVKALYKNDTLVEIIEIRNTKGKKLAKGNYNKGTGNVLFYNPINDVLEKEIHLVNYKRTGELKVYYYEGELKALGKFVNDSLDGPLNVFYKDGKLREKLNYNHGYFDGKQMAYFMNGKVKREENWENGIKINAKEYNKEGKIVSEFSNGIEEKNSYHANGVLHSKTKFVNGLKNGSFVYFHDNRKLKTVEIWRNDTLLSDKQWHSNGCLYSSSQYKNGRKYGTYKEYYPNGKMRVKQEYQNDLQNGPSVSFFPNGKVYAIGQYEDDKPKGKFYLFTDKGIYSGSKIYN